MANAEGLKKRKTNLPPPPLDEVGENITRPHPPTPAPAPYERVDGRSLRRTGRTVQFSTRVTPAFDMQVRQLAERDRLTLAEVLEHAVELYAQQTIK